MIPPTQVDAEGDVAHSKAMSRAIRIYGLPLVVLAACIACTSARPVATPSPSVHPMRVVGYLASWGVRSKGTRIADLPAKDLTHIFYAFGKIGDGGRVVLGDPCVDVGVCATGQAVNPGGNFAELRAAEAAQSTFEAGCISRRLDRLWKVF